MAAQVNATEEFLGLIEQNSLVVELTQRAPLLSLPDTWVVSGCLFQTAWNVLSGQPPTHGIKDYDLFYFDSSDLSAESEEESIAVAASFSPICNARWTSAIKPECIRGTSRNLALADTHD